MGTPPKRGFSESNLSVETFSVDLHEPNRLVFKDAADKLSSRLGNKLLATISPDSVLLKDGEAHRTNRRLILPVFHQQAIAFLFAGHDTTSTMMSWLLFELGNCPEWRQRLRDEQQQVMGTEA